MNLFVMDSHCVQGSEKLLELVSNSPKNQNSPEIEDDSEKESDDDSPPLVNYMLQSCSTKGFMVCNTNIIACADNGSIRGA